MTDPTPETIAAPRTALDRLSDASITIAVLALLASWWCRAGRCSPAT